MSTSIPRQRKTSNTHLDKTLNEARLSGALKKELEGHCIWHECSWLVSKVAMGVELIFCCCWFFKSGDKTTKSHFLNCGFKLLIRSASSSLRYGRERWVK